MRFLCLALLFFAGLRFSDRFTSGVLRITFFDVGQGDAALLRFPHGKVWLVDAGGGTANWDRGRELYLELARMSVLTLDAAILSHPDLDHGLGFRSLWGTVRFHQFWWNSAFTPSEHPLLGKLTALAQDQGTHLIPFSSTRRWQVDGVEVTAYPLPPASSKNESPLALWITFAGRRILLSGDAEKNAERLILEKDPGPVDILKVNHHGSKTSSTEVFLKTLRPQYAIASLGRGNRYGHPAPSVVRRFEENQIPFLRTDELGYVEFEINAEGRISKRVGAEATIARDRVPRQSHERAEP